MKQFETDHYDDLVLIIKKEVEKYTGNCLNVK
jgi:hypothetical protein